MPICRKTHLYTVIYVIVHRTPASNGVPAVGVSTPYVVVSSEGITAFVSH